MIHYIRNSPFISRWLSFGLVILIVVTSCSPETVKSSSFSGKDYVNGIFFGSGPVAALVPEISSKFNLDSYVKSDEERTQIRLIREQLLAVLEPSFLESFKRDMESGNHIVIQQSLKNAALKIKDAMFSENGPLSALKLNANQKNDLIAMTGKEFRKQFFSTREIKSQSEIFKGNEIIAPIKKEELSASLQSQQACIVATVVFAVTAVVAVVGAVAVLLYVVEAEALAVDVCVTVDDAVVSGSQRINGNSLFQEQIVNSIAINLAK